MMLSLERTEGAGNAGCALHPRSRVQGCTKESAHEHTGSAEAIRHSLRNGFTAYAVLSSATNSFCHRRQRIKTCPSPVGPTHLRRLDISNGCQDHTVLPYATSAVRPARRTSLTSFARPAITLRADAAASTASHPAFVTTAKRPSCRERTGRAGRTDLPDSESGIFFAGGLEDPNQIEIAMINRLCERSQTEFRKVGKGEIAPCPPSRARRGLWARCRFAHPTQLVSGL